jgi:hypothetical protein
MSIVMTKEDNIGFSNLNSVRIVNSTLKVFWKTGSDDVDYASINLFGCIDDIDYANIVWSYLKSIHLGPSHLMMTKEILITEKIYFSPPKEYHIFICLQTLESDIEGLLNRVILHFYFFLSKIKQNKINK